MQRRSVTYAVGLLGVVLMVVGGSAAMGGDGMPSTPTAVIPVGLTAGPAGPDASVAPTLDGTNLVDRSQWADIDADGIADDVEEVLCGSATCAKPWDDRDEDGIADWVEVHACGSAICANPATDTSKDGIPDFAAQVLCGEQGCARDDLLGDADTDVVANWIEVVICGTLTCATGNEDYDGDGIADAIQLAACIKDPSTVGGNLAKTGSNVLWWLVFGAGLVCVGAAVLRFAKESKTPFTGRGGVQ